MITKEELLAALEDSSRALDKSTQIYGLALKGLESESTVKRLIQSRDQWRKKYDELADELDDKIIALEETLKAKDADLAEASKIIDEARTKRRALEIQTDHLRNGRLQAEDQIAVLEDKLRDTFSRQYHDKLMDSARRRITALLIERDAFQHLVGELQTENKCMRADLENMCKERDDFKTEIDELETELGSKDDDWRLSVSYYMNLAAVWEKRAEEMRAKLKKFEDFFTSED